MQDNRENSTPPPLDLIDVQGDRSSLIGEAPAVDADGTVRVHPASPNFRTALAAQIAAIAPEVIADGTIDCEKLRALLDDDAAGPMERFGLVWPGKREAQRLAQTPTTATLEPDRESSRDWDTTQNVVIEGDNLEVLKVLQRHYFGQIKMIYIDPPYNTGKDFVYSDDYRDSVGHYLEWTEQVTKKGKTRPNSETEGRFHSNWLNMMYPRLKLARNLLSEDGVIFISIDDSEFPRLLSLATEIFGESNLVGTMIWAAGRKNDSRYISTSHEYIICFSKNRPLIDARGISWKIKKAGLQEIYSAAKKCLREAEGDFSAASRLLTQWYKNLPDSHPAKRQSHYHHIDRRGVYFADNISWPGGGGPRYEVLHPVTGMPVKIPSGGWRFQEDRMAELIQQGRIHFGPTESSVPTVKRYLSETEYETPYSVFYQDGRASTKRLATLLGKGVFDFPKDENVIGTLLKMATSDKDLILDFFAGSGTTAHAVMQLNAEDGGNRRCISVQLPEPTPLDSPAREAGFDTISQITRERIRRAGDKILSDQSAQLATRSTPLDVGFRAYRLSDTHFRKWALNSDVSAEELDAQLTLAYDSAEDAATPEQLFSEVALKHGLSLTESYKTTTIAGLEMFSIEEGLILGYFNEHVTPTLEQLREVIDTHPGQLFMLEDVFAGNDELKANLAQLCSSRGVELVIA
ncbi:site-specific DNA-methyltransferase [Schaalia sp. Marseille-Q2122]|uniref:site-specific DNA-methyltransferase n=1 Tax=Schaalia sp. Marseille-Q2122 TaxID=2736604 RepID=UPI00158CAD45|nr:site-specific DNA-methyltransferase [Schaalia sp. Marseille-Q2122]